MRTWSLPIAVLLAATLSGWSLAGCGGTATSGGSSPMPSPSHATLPPATGKVFDVRSFGATGNGTGDDAPAIGRALSRAAASGGTVHLPPGIYRCATTVRLPDGVRLLGDGSASWLKGQLVFGSADSVERLRIGDVGSCAVTNAANARGTRFVDCRLHGGGSSEGTDSSVVYLGGENSVSDVLFLRCQVERTSYVPSSGANAYAAGVGNTVTIHEFCYLPHGGHVEHITFRDCHLGASNGHDTGALRMMMEAFTWDNHTGLVYHGWKDLVFDGCLVEASDTAGLDFADRQMSSHQHSSSGVLVTGCTFLGAARDRGSGYGGNPITYECPTGIVIRDNTFYASPQQAIGGSHVGQGVTDVPGLLIQGNTFDMTRSPIGLKHETGAPCLNLVGYRSRVVGNTFIYDTGVGLIIDADESPAAGNLVQSNTFTDSRTSGGESTIQLVDLQGRGCFQNRIVGNTITNRGAGTAGVISQQARGTNYATANTIDCGSATPFVVRGGVLVQSANNVR